MADTIERLYKLTVDGTAAARQLAEIARATDNFDKRFASAIDSAKKFGIALAAAVSAGAVVTGIRGIIDGFDQLSKDAQKVGIAAEELQRLRYAADLSGVSAESLDKAIARLSVGMSELAEGTSDTSVALRSIGAQAGESTIDTLKRISDQFQKMPDGLEKTALAVKVFGKAIGPDMIPLLNAGGEALQELADEADRFGGVISGDALKSAEAFNDNLSRLQRTAAGVGAQITAGMLPALQAISQALVDAAKSGDGFVGTGKAIGEMFISLVTYGNNVATNFRLIGTAIGGLAAAVTASSGAEFRATLAAMREDMTRLAAENDESMKKLRQNFAFFSRDVKGLAALGPGTQVLDDMLKRTSAALVDTTKAAEEHRKAEEKRWKQLIESAKQQEVLNDALAETPLRLTLSEQAALKTGERYKELNDQAEAYLDTIEKEGEQLQILVDWLENGTEAQKAFARAQLEASKSSVASTQTLVKQTDEIDILTQGYEGFFDNLAQGAADAEEVFKRTIQSIIAELLKLWAKKYIIDAFSSAFGGGTAAATGAAFSEGKVLPFARGGVISRPVMFPMALAGEAGEEGIFPLKRTASGDLGVQATQPTLNVVVNNYTDATVTTRQNGPDLEILIERTRAAVAGDIRSGGNQISRSIEQAYGIGRGSAAAF